MNTPKTRTIHLPPGCGADLDVPLLHNPYQQAFQEARRLRYCLACKTVGSTGGNGQFVCPKCHAVHVTNLTAPRIYDNFLVLAGRGGGKTLIGAHAAREEMLVPNGIGWVMGATYKILHDSTFPTLVRLIPPDWVAHWDVEHMEIVLKNGHLIAFRSLDDPERARGPHGVCWGWIDEAAQASKRALDVFRPTLIKAGGILIATTTVLGYDWTYEELEKRALIYKEPGYWATKFWTEENPLFASNPVMRARIERDRKTMDPAFFDQEYKAERSNAEGLIYDYKVLAKQMLPTPQAVQQFIPEWPMIDPSRQLLIGLDSGVDHPFGSVLVVVIERGLICVSEYLERNKALSQHLPMIQQAFGLARFNDIKWSANKNEANLRLEFGLKGVGVIPAESKHEIGIQRTTSWLRSGQLYFTYMTPRLAEQMKAYRYADNYGTDGQKKLHEQVFKKNDELPDALRYAIMAWPALPAPTEESTLRDTRKLDPHTRWEIERMREMSKDKSRDLTPADKDYPSGDFYGNDQDNDSELFTSL